MSFTLGTTTASQMTSRTGVVLEGLRSDILAGRRAPGERLPFAELVKDFRCSVGVLREALQRLAEQGLVECEVQQGFRVVRVSEHDLVELTTARCEIEVLALRLAVEGGDVRWEASAVAAHHVLERTAMFDPEDVGRFSEDWATNHARFHHSLLAGCSNRRILSTATSLRDAAELYRRWSVPVGGDYGRDIAGEHRALMEASVSHQTEEACSLLRTHIQRTTDMLLPHVGQDVSTAC